jgi:hypothetical protein
MLTTARTRMRRNVTSDADVRVRFLSTDADVKNTWKYIRVVDVR